MFDLKFIKEQQERERLPEMLNEIKGKTQGRPKNRKAYKEEVEKQLLDLLQKMV